MSTTQDNPFQAPRAELRQTGEIDTTLLLYGPNAVGLATFFGTPLAGAYLLTHNLRRLGLGERVQQVWWTAVGIIAVIMLLAWLLPEHVPGTGLSVAQFLAMHHYAKKLTGEALQRHKDAGGPFLSNWRAFGISLLFLLALLAVLFVGFFVLALFQPS